MAPIPVYVMSSAYLGASDFVAVHAETRENESVLHLKLTPGGREKVNEIGKANANAKRMEDYVGLLLYLDGEPEKAYSMVYEPIPGYELEVRGMELSRMQLLQQAISGNSAL